MDEVKAIAEVHQRELNTYERTIKNGIGAFVEVGNALKAIRDKKLYMLTHRNFESYVKERWGWQKRYAYDLICSSEVAESVRNCAQTQPILTNESQAREVAKAPPEKQAAVVEAAAAKAEAEDRKPTAKDYREAVAEVVYEDAIDDEPEPYVVEKFDAKVIAAFRKAENRLGTLRELLAELSPTEREILKEWLA